MHFKLAYVVAALAPVVSALTPRGPGGNCVPAGGCIPGPLQCCETVTKDIDPSLAALLLLLGLSSNINVGHSCNPVVPPATWSSAVQSTLLLTALTFTNENSYKAPSVAIDCVPAVL
ncbi:hypothetical protein GYMLUDRAFT_239402 [Collybiopsis luxurians FD-317 M1]|nr:hypothetical protein GYMLUDRAFT_239402 [Collybiopsis luxurians FD-317 M1]